jgi:hypothetical protein
VASASAPPFERRKKPFALLMPAVGAPKNRTFACPLNATTIISPALPVAAPCRIAIGESSGHSRCALSPAGTMFLCPM